MLTNYHLHIPPDEIWHPASDWRGQHIPGGPRPQGGVQGCNSIDIQNFGCKSWTCSGTNFRWKKVYWIAFQEAGADRAHPDGADADRRHQRRPLLPQRHLPQGGHRIQPGTSDSHRQHFPGQFNFQFRWDFITKGEVCDEIRCCVYDLGWLDA